MNTTNQRVESIKKDAKWPGVVVSLFIPGFGLFRAGNLGRGLVWFFSFYFAAIIVGLALASNLLPIIVGICALVGAFVLMLWMLYDSFRPGRMTWRLWVLFAVILSLNLILPSPVRAVAHAFKIPTGAMEPTLMGARNADIPDHVIVNRLSYIVRKPERGDLITFSTSSISAITDRRPESTDEVYFVKRVVGLPGERIEIKEGSVFADGVRLGEKDGLPPIEYVMIPSIPTSASKEDDVFIVGENEYFVLGDNSRNSFDSRFWGCVPASNLYGKVTKIYFPFTRIGKPVYVTPITEQKN